MGRFVNHWKRSLLTSLLLVGLIAGAVTIVLAWGGTGHRIINQKAPMHLPASMSALRADSSFYSAHASDADGRKNYSDTAFFAEAPRHFIDIDWYPNYHSLPHDRDSVVKLYGWNAVKNEGVLPWATVMVLDSLTAQLRRGDLATAKYTMSDLGHYVGDAHQPLHCTNNYDGGSTGNSGIHSRYETTMIGAYQSSIIIHTDTVQYVSSPLEYVFAYIYHSNSFVDSIMAADNYAKSVSGYNGSGSIPSAYTAALWLKTGAFTKDQFQRATVALASLWYTAWLNAQSPVVNYDTVVASAIGHGSITPSGTVLVQAGHDMRFTITPQAGYHLDSVKVDGNSVDSTAGYTFFAISQRHTITAWFSINWYTITSSSGVNGLVAPNGAVSVHFDDTQSFIFTPVSGYHVDSLIADGIKLPSASSYSFAHVGADHTLRVTFAIDQFTITAGAAPHGSIVPSGIVTVVSGDSQVFHVKPDSGYFLDSLMVDGEFVGTDTSYTFNPVYQDHTISAKFSDGSVKMECTVYDNWNIVSVPFAVGDYRRSVLFPSAASPAFSYDGAYAREDTLRCGAGYWMKFAGAETLTVAGKPRDTDTINVNEGWNLIGAVSAAVPVSNIASIPPGIATSRFFRYEQGYKTTTTLRGGYGYWVKVEQAGQLIVSSLISPPSANRIRISSRGESPPPPPTRGIAQVEAPVKYRLMSAYPNPFNPATIVHFELPVRSHVSLKLYNLLGQEVQKILDEERSAGRYDVRLDGSLLPSGVYIFRMIAEEFTRSEKVVLLR